MQIVPIIEPNDTEMDDLLRIQRAADADHDPGDPPIPERELFGDLFIRPPSEPLDVWLARDDSQAVALATVQRFTDPDNAHLAELTVVVHPEHRRRGLGSEIVADLLPRLPALGITSVMGCPWEDETIPFVERLGLTRRQEERCSRVQVHDIDESMMDRWVHEAPAAHDGYRVVSWVGEPCADDHVDALAEALTAMADAPLDEVEWVPETYTAAKVREHEASWNRRGLVVAMSLALAPDGGSAGMSAIFVHPDRPEYGHQGDTAVIAAHRGHQLGRWLKAQNYQTARKRFPELAFIETYNAQENQWMLAINIEMGFRPHHIYRIHQADLDVALAAVLSG